MKHYDELKTVFERVSHIKHFLSLGGWDNAVMIPSGGMKARSEASSELVKIASEIMKSPKTSELLEMAQQESLITGWDEANLREMKRTVESYTKVDTEILVEKSKASSECEAAWREARKQNDFSSLAPYMEKLITLTKKQAEQLQSDDQTLYEALLNTYEPELKDQKISTLFNGLKEFLPSAVQEIVEKQSSWAPVQPIVIPIDKQKQLALEVMKYIGFDFNKGRVDESHHPFCGGVPEDVRITSRYDENNFVEGLYAIIHETGHGCYEQGLPKEIMGQPVAEAMSLGIHEGQSLLYEKQLAKTDEFIEFLLKLFKEHLPEQNINLNSLKHSILKVEPGKIRVNADEVTYPLHIILRYEIEKDLIEGDLKITDLPAVWDQKMQQYLGISTQGDDKNGCMQDIHWMFGAYGYFPTYTLGAMNAAQLFAKYKESNPKWSGQTKEGDFAPLKQWLGDKVWSQAKYYSTADELMASATGEPLNAQYFNEHIQTRYLKS